MGGGGGGGPAEPTAERYPRLNPSKNLAKHVLDPCDCTTKNLSGKAVKYPSLRADECRRGNPVKNAALSCHSELVSESVTCYEQESNIGQTLKRSCSTREKRHREKRGFRLVPLLARAVQGDKFLSLRVGFTMAARLSRCHNGLVGLRSAFTMAEILLSLTIIGVVAAITLPSLTGNINERTWNTQRKALYARFSQAIALMPALNGYGTLTEGDSSASAEDTAAETFVTAGLSKVLKINNICDSEHLADCGVPSKITGMNGSQVFSAFPKSLLEYNSIFNGSFWDEVNSRYYAYSQLNTKTAAFETANGESIAVFYNPNCQGNFFESGTTDESWHFSQPKMCANFVYDLNGTKGPNSVGKDIGFITAIYPTDSVVVAPMPESTNTVHGANANALVGICRARDDARVPNREELTAIVYNAPLIGFSTTTSMVSSTRPSSSKHWRVNMGAGDRFVANNDSGGCTTMCIKRN